MAPLVKPRRQAERRKATESLEYTSANFLGLICAVVILVAFIFLPWLWTGAKFNGARFMSEVLTGGNMANFGSDLLVLVPLAALLAGGTAVWGLLNAHRGRTASLLTIGLGLVGLIYYLDLYFVQDGEVPAYIRANIGTGFKVALVATLGLLLQAILLLPAINLRFSRITQRLSSAMPSVPQRYVPYLFLLIPMLLYLVWIIGPTFYTFYLSLTELGRRQHAALYWPEKL